MCVCVCVCVCVRASMWFIACACVQGGNGTAGVTQGVGDARLDAGHAHVADAVLVLGFHQHGDLDVPQRLHGDLSPHRERSARGQGASTLS